MGQQGAFTAKRSVLTPGDACFPPALAAMGVSKLYCIGDTSLLRDPLLVVVGSRRTTPYGIAGAEICGRVAAEHDIVTATSAQQGCHHAATRCALDAGGRTVIVTGVGPDIAYPTTSLDVFEDTKAQGGLIVSAEPWGRLPQPVAAIRKDEILATLAKVLVVCEAHDRSSSIHMARVARTAGAKVYVVPGSIFSPECAGANCLLQDGAYAVTSDRDLRDRIALDFGIEPDRRAKPASPPLGQVLGALAANPMRPEQLSQAVDVTVLTLLRTLIDYEHRGIVERMPDGRYSLTPASYERISTNAEELSLI